VVLAFRGPVVESRHVVHAAVCRADGTLVASCGDPEHVTYLRSSAKPLQALCSVRAGVVDEYGLDERQLAVSCSSHHGTPEHAAAVAGLLQRAGIPLSQLRPRGLHPPISPSAALHLAREGRVYSPLEHNCSGNHALLLAYTKLQGLDLDTYLDVDGAPQAAATEGVRAVFGSDGELGRDHCGMTAYAYPLTAMATAYARLATGSGLNGYADAAARIVAAMRANPRLVSGDGGLDTLAMALDGVVSKGGAKGLACCGSSITGLGAALKVEDGDGGIAQMAGTLLVERVAGTSTPELRALRERPLLDGLGNAIGHYELRLEL
jgi:L-asparaginase II